MKVKAVRILLRRHTVDHVDDPLGASIAYLDYEQYLDDEQFEVLESGSVWDEAAEDLAARVPDRHS